MKTSGSRKVLCPESPYMTVVEVAELLKRTPYSVRTSLKAWGVDFIKTGESKSSPILVLKASLQNFLASRLAKTQEKSDDSKYNES